MIHGLLYTATENVVTVPTNARISSFIIESLSNIFQLLSGHIILGRLVFDFIS